MNRQNEDNMKIGLKNLKIGLINKPVSTKKILLIYHTLKQNPKKVFLIRDFYTNEARKIFKLLLALDLVTVENKTVLKGPKRKIKFIYPGVKFRR